MTVSNELIDWHCPKPIDTIQQKLDVPRGPGIGRGMSDVTAGTVYQGANSVKFGSLLLAFSGSHVTILQQA
jgi:hypothetical protein